MVLLVIDTQTLITNDKLYRFDLFVSSVKKLIALARDNNIEVIYVRHDDGPKAELTRGKDGFEIYEGFCPLKDEKIFDKKVNSPFKESGLLQYLKEKEVKDLIVCGLQSDYCIDATIKCAFEHDFQVFVPAGANTTIDNAFMSGEKSYKYYNEWIWNHRYATCLSLEAMIPLMYQR